MLFVVHWIYEVWGNIIQKLQSCHRWHSAWYGARPDITLSPSSNPHSTQFLSKTILILIFAAARFAAAAAASVFDVLAADLVLNGAQRFRSRCAHLGLGGGEAQGLYRRREENTATPQTVKSWEREFMHIERWKEFSWCDTYLFIMRYLSLSSTISLSSSLLCIIWI